MKLSTGFSDLFSVKKKRRNENEKNTKINSNIVADHWFSRAQVGLGYAVIFLNIMRSAK